MIKFSAVICTYQRYPVLERAIHSLLAQSIPADIFEIIIVDNSPDQSAGRQFAGQFAGHAHLQYITTPISGLSNARNEGIRLARGPIVGFIDDDAIAHPGWAGAIIQGFEETSALTGVVGGAVKPLWQSKRPDWLSDALLAYLSILDFGSAARFMPPGHNVFGCNMALDKALALECGGFARHLGRNGTGIPLLSNEEPDLFEKIRAKGRLMYYTPDAVVDHHIDPARLTHAWFRRRAAWQAVSDWLMMPEVMAGHAQGAIDYLTALQTSGTRPLSAAFFDPAATTGQFEEDLFIIRQLVIATLNGGAEMTPAAQTPILLPAAQTPISKLLSKLRMT